MNSHVTLRIAINRCLLSEQVDEAADGVAALTLSGRRKVGDTCFIQLNSLDPTAELSAAELEGGDILTAEQLVPANADRALFNSELNSFYRENGAGGGEVSRMEYNALVKLAIDNRQYLTAAFHLNFSYFEQYFIDRMNQLLACEAEPKALTDFISSEAGKFWPARNDEESAKFGLVNLRMAALAICEEYVNRALTSADFEEAASLYVQALLRRVGQRFHPVADALNKIGGGQKHVVYIWRASSPRVRGLA